MSEQALRALDLANRTRLSVAEVKSEITQGTLRVAAALDDLRAQPMRVGDLLDAQHGWGPQRTQRFLAPARIGYRRRVRDLTDHQRQWLTTALQSGVGMDPWPSQADLAERRLLAREVEHVLTTLQEGALTHTGIALRLHAHGREVRNLDRVLEHAAQTGQVNRYVRDGFTNYSVHTRLHEALNTYTKRVA